MKWSIFINLCLLFASCTYDPHKYNLTTTADLCFAHVQTLTHDPETVATIKNKLVAIHERDQWLRLRLDTLVHSHSHLDILFDSLNHSHFADSIRKYDAENIAYIATLIKFYGWLPGEIIGEHGEKTLFLVVAHADLKTQLIAMPSLYNAALSNKVPREHFAMIFDKALIKMVSYQVYGTQGYFDRGGKFHLTKVWNSELMNRRREWAGMEPLSI